MTVGELRKALVGLPANMDVVVRASGEDGSSICNTPWHVGQDTGCDSDEEGPLFAIEVSEVDE